MPVKLHSSRLREFTNNARMICEAIDMPMGDLGIRPKYDACVTPLERLCYACHQVNAWCCYPNTAQNHMRSWDFGHVKVAFDIMASVFTRKYFLQMGHSKTEAIGLAAEFITFRNTILSKAYYNGTVTFDVC